MAHKSRSGRSGSGKGRSFGPKPVEVGKEYDLKIEEVGRRGDGIAKIEDFVIFVPSTGAGQRMRVRILQVSERYAIGEAVGIAAEDG